MADASTPVTIDGRYLWRGKERFLIRGVVYQNLRSIPDKHWGHSILDGGDGVQQQSDPRDPLTDDSLPHLEDDLVLLKELGVNAIETLHFDNTVPHERALKLLEQAGIYVNVQTETHSIRTPFSQPFRGSRRLQHVSPGELSSNCYRPQLLEHHFRTLDQLTAHPNVLGVYASSKDIRSSTGSAVAPIIRACVRDMKAYVTRRNLVTGKRVLPIGVNMSDVAALAIPSLQYFAAGPKDSRPDFYACNNYSWCSPSNIRMSGWQEQIEQFHKLASIPVFLSEYGANTNGPRPFEETRALSSPEVTHVYSGGFAYCFWETGNSYGLVSHVPDAEFATRQMLRQLRAEAGKEDGDADMKRMWEFNVLEADKHALREFERVVVEVRMTDSVGRIAPTKDFESLGRQLKETKDVELRTEGAWASDEAVEGKRAGFPERGEDWVVDGDGGIPESCVDWRGMERGMDQSL